MKRAVLLLSGLSLWSACSSIPKQPDQGIFEDKYQYVVRSYKDSIPKYNQECKSGWSAVVFVESI